MIKVKANKGEINVKLNGGVNEILLDLAIAINATIKAICDGEGCTQEENKKLRRYVTKEILKYSIVQLASEYAGISTTGKNNSNLFEKVCNRLGIFDKEGCEITARIMDIFDDIVDEFEQALEDSYHESFRH